MGHAGAEWVRPDDAERLVLGVELVLQQWRHDPAEAVAGLDRLLRTATPQAVIMLEGAYRRRHHSLAALLDTERDVLLDSFGARATAVAALLSFDRSGYLREAGVRWLAVTQELFVLPFLLLRLNDAVDPVRRQAEAAVRDRLGVGQAAVLVRLLPLLEGLGARRRAGPVVRSIADLLRGGDPRGPAALWAGVRTGDPAVRASCLRLLATIEPAAAVQAAVATGEPALRHWAAGVATAPRLDPATQRMLLPLLERDPNPRIRWRALRARARHADSEPYLRHALLDPDARVRYLARVRLRDRGHVDATELYRDTIRNHSVSRDALIGALAGLADMGTRDDIALVIPFLNHTNARVRGEAWRTMATLDPAALTARIDQLRTDPSSKVRRHLPNPPPAAG